MEWRMVMRSKRRLQIVLNNMLSQMEWRGTLQGRQC